MNHPDTPKRLLDAAKHDAAAGNRLPDAALLLEDSPVGLYRTTDDGRILAANGALARLLGFASVEELVRVRSTELHEEAADRDAATSEQAR